MKYALLAGLSLAAVGLAAPTGASAQALRIDPAPSATTGAQITPVQYRYGGRHYNRGRYYGGPRYGYRGRNRGAAIGAGIAGLAAGAIIGGAIANSQPSYAYGEPTYAYGGGPADDGSVAYCMQRFRSYDPASGTYLGYDGLRHPCP